MNCSTAVLLTVLIALTGIFIIIYVLMCKNKNNQYKAVGNAWAKNAQSNKTIPCLQSQTTMSNVAMCYINNKIQTGVAESDAINSLFSNTNISSDPVLQACIVSQNCTPTSAASTLTTTARPYPKIRVPGKRGKLKTSSHIKYRSTSDPCSTNTSCSNISGTCGWSVSQGSSLTANATNTGSADGSSTGADWISVAASCPTPVNPIIQSPDHCTSLTSCNYLSGNCGWSIAQNTGLDAGANGSTDGTSTGADWVTNTNNCPSTVVPSSGGTTAPIMFSCQGDYCVSDPNGTFSDINSCINACPATTPANLMWGCDGQFCFVSPTGTYTSQQACLSGCVPTNINQPSGTYNGNYDTNISGTACVQDPQGNYSDLQSCNIANGFAPAPTVNPPSITWDCGSDGYCYQNTSGTGKYPDLGTCVKSCPELRPSNKKFSCDSGSNMCYEDDTNGTFSQIGACNTACQVSPGPIVTPPVNPAPVTTTTSSRQRR